MRQSPTWICPMCGNVPERHHVMLTPLKMKPLRRLIAYIHAMELAEAGVPVGQYTEPDPIIGDGDSGGVDVLSGLATILADKTLAVGRLLRRVQELVEEGIDTKS